MSTRAFFLNSDTTIYGEEEMNFVQKFLLDQGVLNTEGADWEDFFANGDLKVTERGAGANMSVDVAPGWAIISTIRNSISFKIFCQSIGVTNLPVTANSSGNNRVDAVIMKVARLVEPNILANNIVTLEVVEGDDTSPLSDNDIQTAIGANFDFIRLADITVPDSTSDIEDGDIADTRVRAKTNNAFSIAPEAIEFRVLAGDPDTANLAEGTFWFNSTNHTLNFWNGTSIISLGGAAGGFNPLAPSAQTSPDMTVAVASGELRFGKNGVPLHYAGGNSSNFTAPVTGGHKRIDLLCINKAGTLSIIQGTSTAGSPTAPTYPANLFVICEVYLRNGMTVIKDTDDSTNGYILRDARGFTVAGDEPTLLAGENITALDGCFINDIDSKIYRAHGHKSNTTNNITFPGSNNFNDWVRLSDTLIMMLYYSSNTLSIRIWDKTSGGSGSSQTVTTSFQSSSHNNNLTRAAVARIDDNKFVCFYTKTSSSTDKMYFRTGSISGGTITMDTETLYTGSQDYIYCIVACNGNEDGKVGLSFVHQSGGNIGSSSTLVHNVAALTVAQNSVTVNSSYTSNTISSGSFWPTASWNSIVGTDNGVYIAVMTAQDSGGTYAMYMSALDRNTGSGNHQSGYKFNSDAQGSNRYSTRAYAVAHNEEYVSCWYESDQYTGGSHQAIKMIIANMAGIREEVMHANGGGNTSPSDVAAVPRPIAGCQHGVFIPAERTMFRHGRFYTYSGFRGNPFENNRVCVVGPARDRVVYNDNGSSMKEDYIATLFDGFSENTVSSGAEMTLQDRVMTGLTVTANRQYFLKDAFTNPGEIATSGVTKVGKSISSSVIRVKARTE